jgi:FKBP-type peptidyl-prolyl cis-trans isomerase
MKKVLYVIIVIAIILLAVYIVNYDSDKGPVLNNNVNTVDGTSTSTATSSVGADVVSCINNNIIKKMDTEKISKAGDKLTVHYVGTLENGTKFDSSVDRGKPFEFVVGIGQVIRGWDEGMVGMKIGEKKHLVIPGEKAYGSNGISDGQGGYMIPPNATLIFDVELLGIESR